MLDNELQQRLEMLWPNLAQPVRAAILDQEYKHAVRNATSEYALSNEEREACEMEVLMVLLNLQTKADFLNGLAEHIPAFSKNDALRVGGHVETHFFALLSPYLDQQQPSLEPAAPAAPLSPGVVQGSTSPLEQFIRRQNDVSAKLVTLPEEVRITILSSTVAGAFGEVVRAHNLSQDQFAQLGDMVVRVLVGLSTTQDFRAWIPKLGMPANAQEPFAAAIEQGMFKPVRDAIGRVLAQRPAAA